MKTYKKEHTNTEALKVHSAKIKKRGGKYSVKGKVITYSFPVITWYHGSDNLFEMPEFKTDKSTSDIGFHAGNLKQAKNIKLKIKNGLLPDYINVYKVNRINPLRVNDMLNWTPSDIAQQLIKRKINVSKSGNLLGNRFHIKSDIVDALKNKGYDSLIYVNEYEGYGDTLVLFSKKQLQFVKRIVT